MRLLYTGPGPITFASLGVEVEPGDEFDAPDDLAEGFLARADVEQAPAAAKPKRGAKTSPTPDPAGEAPASAVIAEEA